MFGLPIFRKETTPSSANPSTAIYDDIGVNGCTISSPTYDPTVGKCLNIYAPKDPFKPKVLNSALRLCQMSGNHYSLIVSSDWKHLAAWGATPSYGYTGVTANSNKPQTCVINWDSVPQSIFKVTSIGYAKATIFRTENNELYGTGNNAYYILNKTSTGVQTAYNLISKNVIDYCMSSPNRTNGPVFLLYVKADGKVYGLGSSNVGFGFAQTAQKDLKIDDEKGSNYLGVYNASKVFTTCPDNQHKSFVLLNDGTVMACGYNTDGCLGVNKTDAIVYEWTPVQKSDNNGTTVTKLTDVVDIVTTNFVNPEGANAAAGIWSGVTGSKHMTTYFLCKNGSVYTCGNNIYGQLGLNIATNQKRIFASKTSIVNGSKICTAAGGTSILVTTTDDKVYTWGNNQWGQLGLGHLNDISVPTQATFPTKKIKQIHGGGMYGIINGAFLIVCDDGTLYAAGYNKTYALGITNSGTPNQGPITTFTRNEYFGENPTQRQDTRRYPLTNLQGSLIKGSNIITVAELSQVKSVVGPSGNVSENVFVNVGMSVTGNGIPSGTKVLHVDRIKNEITISNTATISETGVDLTYDSIIKVYQADLCGYGTEMAQKIVTEDGTLYMSGWNQNVDGVWNFNYYYGNQNVSVPTYFDANFN